MQNRSAHGVGAEGALDGLIFCGNPHESVPRALLVDDRLTPLERNAWQIIRMQVERDGITAFPTYDSLRPYLSSVPCSGRASDETIARALTLLRLTRWLSLVRHRRRAADGRILGNLYVLHDEPLSPNEAIQLDPHYLGLVSDALMHAGKAVQRVGFHTLREISTDPLLSGRSLPSRLQVLTQRMASQGWKLGDAREPVEPDEEKACSPASIGTSTPSSESEGSTASQLRNPKMDPTVRTVRTDYINGEDVLRTVPEAHTATSETLVTYWFERLPPEQRSGALAALQQLNGALRQAVLEEWARRCGAATVRNPARYLFGLIQRALRGEFNALIRQSNARGHLAKNASRSDSPPEHGDSQDKAAVRQHIETLRDLLRIR